MSFPDDMSFLGASGFIGIIPEQPKQEMQEPPSPIQEKDEAQERGWLGWFAQTVILTESGARDVIAGKREQINQLFKSEEINKKIDSHLVPKIKEFINDLPQMAAQEGTLSHWAVKKGVEAAGENLFLWIEAIALTVIVNITEAARLQEAKPEDILPKLLEFLAGQADENLEELISGLGGIEVNIRDCDFKIDQAKKALEENAAGEEQDLVVQIQNLQRHKQTLEAERESLFSPMVKNLFQLSFPNGAKDLTLPSIPFVDVKEFLYSYAKDYAPIWLSKKTGSLVKSKSLPIQTLSSENEARFRNLKGSARLEKLADQIFELVKPQIWDFLKKNTFELTKKLDAQLNTGMEFEGMIKFELQLREAVDNPSMQAKLNPYIHYVFKNFILFSLKNMAINGPDEKGDAFANVLLLLRQRMSEQNLEGLIAGLDYYHKFSSPLQDIDKEIGKLKKEMIALAEQNPAIDKGKEKVNADAEDIHNQISNSDLQALRSEIKALKQQILDFTMNPDLDEDAPDVLKALDRIEQAIKEKTRTLFSSIGTRVEILERHRSNQLDQINQAWKEDDVTLEGIKEEVEAQFQPFILQIVRDAGLTGTIWQDLSLKFLPEAILDIHLNAGQALWSREVDRSDKMFNAARQIGKALVQRADNWATDNMEAVADKAAKFLNPTLQISAHPAEVQEKKKAERSSIREGEFLLPLAMGEFSAQILQVFDGLLGNLQKIQQDNPRYMTQMSMAFIGAMTSHLALAHQVVKEKGKRHLHEVDPYELREAFEANGKLHPAMAKAKSLKSIDKLQRKLQRVKADQPNSGERIARLEEKIKAKKAKIQEKMVDQFYNKFSVWLLNMAGKHGPEDISIGFGLEEEVWKKINEALPELLMDSFESALASEKIHGILAEVIRSINEALAEPPAERKASQSQTKEKVEAADGEADKVQIVKFLEQIALLAPDTLMASMLNWGMIKNLTAAQLEAVLNKALGGIQIDKMFEELVINSAAGLASEKPAKAPSSRPSDEDNKKTIDEDSEKIIEKIRLKTAEFLSSRWWGKILGLVFGWLIERIFARLQKDVRETASSLRKDFAEVPIHGNLLFGLGELLMASYQPVRLEP